MANQQTQEKTVSKCVGQNFYPEYIENSYNRRIRRQCNKIQAKKV